MAGQRWRHRAMEDQGGGVPRPYMTRVRAAHRVRPVCERLCVPGTGEPASCVSRQPFVPFSSLSSPFLPCIFCIAFSEPPEAALRKRIGGGLQGGESPHASAAFSPKQE